MNFTDERDLESGASQLVLNFTVSFELLSCLHSQILMRQYSTLSVFDVEDHDRFLGENIEEIENASSSNETESDQNLQGEMEENYGKDSTENKDESESENTEEVAPSMGNHEDQTNYILCQTCGEQYSSRRSLHNHKYDANPGTQCCKLCLETFPRDLNYRHVREVHRNIQGGFSCSYYGKIFSRKDYVKEHEKKQ